MEDTFRRRLLHLREVMQAVKDQGFPFDMSDWADCNPASCRTVCCAAGWACFDRAFQQEGLHLRDNDDRPILEVAEFTRLWTAEPSGHLVSPFYKNEYSYCALDAFFGRKSRKIFNPVYYPGFMESRPISVDQVIARIDEVLQKAT